VTTQRYEVVYDYFYKFAKINSVYDTEATCRRTSHGLLEITCSYTWN